MATCQGTRKDGRRCATPVVGAASYCFGHDPAMQARRAEARRRGGRNRSNAARLSKLMPARLVPVFAQLEAALGEVHRGDLDPRIAGAMATLGRALAAILQAGELEQRLRDLEAAQGEGRADRWRA